MAREITLEQLCKAGLEEGAAAHMLNALTPHLSLPADECWRKISKEILTPDHPFELHGLLHKTVFSNWDPALGPPPAWFPPDEYVKTTNIARLMQKLDLGSYGEFHAWSARNRDKFWGMMVEQLGILFKRKYDRVVDLSAGLESPKWLPGAMLNIADSCFSAPGNAPAIVYQAEGGSLSTMTYHELARLTNRVANSLRDAGFCPQDSIAIDMPMTAESVAIYLGIVKSGCAVVSIADSFAPDEIQVRLRLAHTKAIFTQDYITRGGKLLPLYERIVSARAPRAIVLSFNGPFQLRGGDMTWDEFLGKKERFESIPADPSSHINILFSSGTTAEPKAIPWPQTGPIKCAADGYLHHDIRPGDVVAWPTNLGWMMGPWLIFATLINRGTIALYYGSPAGREFGGFVQKAGVNILGVVPTLVRAWKNSGCMKGLNWRAIRAFSSTGECSNSEDMLFLMSLAGYSPVIEYCGGTEISGGYITGTMVQPAAPATFTTPAAGLDFVILDEEGERADNGEVFLIPPSIGLSTELLNKDHHEVYYENTPQMPVHEQNIPGEHTGPQQVPLRRHGDQLERLGGGFYRMHGRVDDTMNLGGIKVSSAEIERVLNSVAGIRETAAIAVSAPGGGPSQLVVYAVPAPGEHPEKEALKASLQTAIKQRLNPLFKIHDVVVADSLARTASNKVMRRVLRERYREEQPLQEKGFLCPKPSSSK